MYVVFHSRSSDIDLWVDIFSYLENSSAGAKLQDKMEVFGQVVDEKLESLIDYYGAEDAFTVEFWSHEETEFSVMLAPTSPVHGEALMDLLRSCPIEAPHVGSEADW